MTCIWQMSRLLSPDLKMFIYNIWHKLFWIDNLQTPKLTFQLSQTFLFFILFTRKWDYTHLNSKCDSSIIDSHNWSSNINLRCWSLLLMLLDQQPQSVATFRHMKKCFTSTLWQFLNGNLFFGFMHHMDQTLSMCTFFSLLFYVFSR